MSRSVVVVIRLLSAATVLRRLARAARAPAPLAIGAPGAADAAEGLRISVIIPARDEAGRIAPCLERLRSAPGVVEVIVVDDQSGDDTAAVATRRGARVVVGAPLPDGWAGKAWALEQGLRAADGEWIVTLDADTRPDPQLPAELVARMVADRLDFATVAGRFDCPTRGARWLHPALLTTLVYRYGPPGSKSDLANGQCMAARRETWLASGGMRPVGGAVVEDVALVRHLRRSGLAVALLDGAPLLTVRMYESFAATWSGWGRSIALGGVDTSTRQVGHLVALTATQAAPLVRIVTRRADRLDLLLVTCRIGTLVGTARAYDRRDLAYWLSPLADVAAVGRVAWSTIKRPTAWRGRSYAGR